MKLLLDDARLDKIGQAVAGYPLAGVTTNPTILKDARPTLPFYDHLRAIREAGVSPEEVLGVLAWWSGWAQWGEAVSLPEILRRYDPAAIPHTPAVLTDEVRQRLRVL